MNGYEDWKKQVQEQNKKLKPGMFAEACQCAETSAEGEQNEQQ